MQKYAIANHPDEEGGYVLHDIEGFKDKHFYPDGIPDWVEFIGTQEQCEDYCKYVIKKKRKQKWEESSKKKTQHNT